MEIANESKMGGHKDVMKTVDKILEEFQFSIFHFFLCDMQVGD